MRLFRREDLDTLSRALGVTAGALSRWWEDFLAGGQAALKVRPAGQDPQAEVITRLRAKIGELTMENALLWDKTDRLEQNRPLPARRSRR